MRCVPALALLALITLPSAASAQGLVWTLPPEDGTAATYAGTYTQILRRQDSNEQDVELSFNRELRVRSVGGREIEWRGQTQPGRWIEFEQTTQTGGAVQDIGPGGTVIVKLLVPEAYFDGSVTDPNGIPKTSIPFVRGYEQRDGGAIAELTGGAYQPFPSITLLRMTKALNESNGAWSAEEVVESPGSRLELNTQLVRDDQTPFGVQSWTVTSKQSVKRPAQVRDAFTLTSETTESMELKRVESGAVSAIDRD